jgi:putative transposase
MTKDSTEAVSNILLGADWHDSIEACVRTQIRGFIEEMLEVQLSNAPGRARYARASAPKRSANGATESGSNESEIGQSAVGHRNGHRDRELMGNVRDNDSIGAPCARVWRKIKGDWDAWNKRDVGTKGIIRLILDGTVVRVRVDREATSISLLIVLGVRRDGQKVLLAVRSMGGESEAAWRTVLDDKPEMAIVEPSRWS